MKSSAWVLHSSQALTDWLTLVPFTPPLRAFERGFSLAPARAFYSQPELIGSDFRENSPEHRGFLQAQAELFAGYGFRFFLTIFDCHQLSPIGKNNEPE
jgi:hypothetical protein